MATLGKLLLVFGVLARVVALFTHPIERDGGAYVAMGHQFRNALIGLVGSAMEWQPRRLQVQAVLA